MSLLRADTALLGAHSHLNASYQGRYSGHARLWGRQSARGRHSGALRSRRHTRHSRGQRRGDRAERARCPAGRRAAPQGASCLLVCARWLRFSGKVKPHWQRASCLCRASRQQLHRAQIHASPAACAGGAVPAAWAGGPTCTCSSGKLHVLWCCWLAVACSHSCAAGLICRHSHRCV